MQCRIDIPKENNQEVKQLTVGQVFQISCDGDWPPLNPDAVELRLDPNDQYKLKLLKFSFPSKTEGALTVTSYKVGEHHLKALQLVDKDQSVVLGDLNFTVASVINPKEPPQEPYGPFGPFSLSVSIWYPLTALLILLSVMGFFLYRWKIRRDKKRLLAEMRISDSAQSPYFQFYHSVRKLQRSYSYFSGGTPTSEENLKFIEDLGAAYKIYLARQFEVPTLKWSERKILSDLKRNHKKFYAQFRLEVRKALAEISRAQNAQSPMTGKDCQQLLDLLRKQVDRIEEWMKGKQK